MKQHVVIFILFSLIIIPAVFLSYFAFEGIDQREADMRNSFSNTLLLELTQTNTRIAYLLDEMREDLHESLPRGLGEDTGKKLAAWNMQEPLIGMPYLVSPDRRILYPDLAAPGGDEGFADAVNLFYWRHLNFFNSSEPIPVYKSIALAYEEEILLSQNAREESLDEYASADSGSVAMSKKEAAPSPSLSRSKAASGIFETNEAVQEEVYRRAEEEGRMPLTRNVLPRLAEDKPADDTNNAGIRSVFIESTQYFNDLIRDQDYGLIPRVFDSAFMLLFWEKQGDLIAGCELDMDAVKDLLLSALPAPADQTRYINILDNSGRPLVPFATLDETQWQRPFVAKEINELLPYWETASILTDPDAFEEQVRSSRLFMLTLIILLSAAILTGMTAVYR
ncbi:MAG: hypothetical protein JXB03_04875, partial [Spirochaetales bacterium]|nr:hypothetical protein [Spirochaetales bacterium]